MRTSRLLLFAVILCSAEGSRYCAQCIDPEAKEAERINHDARTVRLNYTDQWGSCSNSEEIDEVMTEGGCFRARMYDGPIPKGYYHLMMGPISSLLTMNGEDFRWITAQGKVYARGYDDTLFEIELCYDNRCFVDDPKHWADRRTPGSTCPTQAPLVPRPFTRDLPFYRCVACIIAFLSFSIAFTISYFFSRRLIRKQKMAQRISLKAGTSLFTAPTGYPVFNEVAIV